MPSESLTPNLTMPCIGWVQAGGVWALRVPSFHMCPKSACCSFVCHGLEACLHSLPFVFFELLCRLLFGFPLLSSVGPYLIMDLIFLWPTSWLPSFSAVLFCYFCCNDSILLGLFRPAVYSFPQWLGMTIGFPTYRLMCPFCLSLGHPWPTYFLWAFLTILLTLHFHGFLLTSLGFPWPNYLILILGVHGPSINPLLSLFALLWACGDPFSLFYIIYFPWVCYFSLSRLL